MKKIIFFFIGVLLLIILAVGAMFVFNVCPPKGPWPMPPWCGAGFTQYEYELNIATSHLPQTKAVNMYDTWGRNYNMGMVENTRNNIESSFDRVRSLGAQEVYVHDFHWAIFEDGADFTSTKYQIGDEIFWNDMRDETMTNEDLQKMAAAAHARGLKLGVKHNLHFVDIGKYVVKGMAGEIQETMRADYERFNAEHSEEWVRDFFAKWQGRLVERARVYNASGVDILSISPSFMDPRFSGHEELANELWAKLITEIRKEFSGQIAVDFNVYGFNDGNNAQENWRKYDFYKNADIVEVKVYKILEKYQNLYSGEDRMQKAITKMIDDFDARAKELGIKISIFFAPSSYAGGVFAGPVEYLDVKNPEIIALRADYEEQLRAFQYFFEAVKDKENVVRLNVGNFAWDDALDPEVKPKISVSASFRNKPAENAVEMWFNK